MRKNETNFFKKLNGNYANYWKILKMFILFQMYFTNKCVSLFLAISILKINENILNKIMLNRSNGTN